MFITKKRNLSIEMASRDFSLSISSEMGGLTDLFYFQLLG